MPCPKGRALAWCAVVALALMVTGCSGGDGDDPNFPPADLFATITSVDSSTYASFGVICINFQITGPPNTAFELLTQYQVGGGTAMLGSTPSPSGFTSVPPGSGTVGLVVPASGVFNGTYYWYAGADLGFLASTATFAITPFSNGNPNQPNGTPGVSGPISYGGGNPSTTSTGLGAGTGTAGNPPGGLGRAAHTATNVRGGSSGSLKNLLIAGGYNAGGTPGSNAFTSADRFNFNQNTFQHTIPFQGNMANEAPLGRVLHASSFFLDSATGFIRVLVTGGLSFCDPSQTTLAARINGATAYSTANVFSFSPTEQLAPTLNSLSVNRFGHTATWVPNNTVVLIGGASNPGNPGTSLITGIEVYSPATNTFAAGPVSGQCPTGTISFPRVEHSATLMADGRILVAGGYDPSSPSTPLLCEIYDPRTGCCTPVGSSQLLRFAHTATRLANGWIVLIGGRSTATGTLIADARIFKPELGTLDPIAVSMDRARALHQATLLGNRQVLVTGGLTAPNGSSIETFTTNSQILTVPDCFSPGNPTAFTNVNVMSSARAEHTATASDCGTVFIVGGRNSVGSASGLNFLDSIEFYAFSNSVPVISAPLTAASAAASSVAVNFMVSDTDADGGYVVIRFRTTPGSGPWTTATITSQNHPENPSNTFPNHEVCPGNYSFVWAFGQDGVASGSTVEIQIIPFGAVIGSPVQFVARTP